MPLPFIGALALPALSPLLAPVGAVVRGLLGILKRMRFTVNGVVVVLLIAGMAAGGWWIARNARANALASRMAHEAVVTAAIEQRLAHWSAFKRGDIAADDARIAAISGRVRELLAAIPPETVTKLETKTETVYVPIPSTLAAPAFRTTTSRVDGDADRRAAALLDELNKINVRP